MGVGLVLISLNSLFDFHINTIIICTLKTIFRCVVRLTGTDLLVS